MIGVKGANEAKKEKKAGNDKRLTSNNKQYNGKTNWFLRIY